MADADSWYTTTGHRHWRKLDDPIRWPGVTLVASFWPSLTRHIKERSGKPIAMVAGCVGSTSIQQWIDTYWPTTWQLIQDTVPAGQRIDAVLWNQGEEDAAAGGADCAGDPDCDAYQTLVNSLFNTISTNLSSRGHGTPKFFMTQLGHFSDRTESELIRGAQAAVCDDRADCCSIQDLAPLGYTSNVELILLVLPLTVLIIVQISSL